MRLLSLDCSVVKWFLFFMIWFLQLEHAERRKQVITFLMCHQRTVKGYNQRVKMARLLPSRKAWMAVLISKSTHCLFGLLTLKLKPKTPSRVMGGYGKGITHYSCDISIDRFLNMCVTISFFIIVSFILFQLISKYHTHLFLLRMCKLYPIYFDLNCAKKHLSHFLHV